VLNFALKVANRVNESNQFCLEQGFHDMHKFSILAAAISGAFLTAAPAQAANLLTNGGFEDPAIGGFFQNFGSGSTAITGWTVDAIGPSENVDIVNGLFTPGGPSPAFEGSQYLDLVGFGTLGSIFQSFSTVAGQGYVLNFAYSHNLFGGDSSADAVVGLANGGSAGPAIFQTVFSHSSGTSTNLDWRNFSVGFVAAGAQTTLVFLSNNNGTNAGVLLDDVSVNAVPEPASWALMIMGFGLVGSAVRRRKPTVRVSFA
jgi:choice-of-anchor C domain-containing protein